MSTRTRLPRTPRPLHERRMAFVFVALLSILVELCPVAEVRASEAELGFRVVVHPDNRSAKLPRRRLANLFLKEVVRWEDGEAARPVDLKPEAPARRRFSEVVLSRSVAAVKSYWQQRIFSGRGVPPPELEADQAVIQYVTKHRGAVGYVSPGAELGKAKILNVE